MNALILIAEDEPEIAEILDAYLTREGYRTYQVANGQSALDVQPVLKPDLVLLDIKMPGKDGWEVLSELRRRGDTPVVIVTALDQDIDRLQGLRIGADDYVAKPFNPVEVVARVGAVLRRTGGSRTEPVLRVGRLEIDTQSYMASVRSAPGVGGAEKGGVQLALTLTEFRMLAHMAKSPNRVFTRGELVDACLPGGDALERTVDSHVSNLRKKLDKAGASEVIAVVRGVGYRLGDAE
ncbi:response regulator [Paraburkholderia unamae]|uniref:Winged helix family two component transcriptional regulator n=1 Tax=Paraburkholderia unamae TaxID=219649 RepID=A0ABX5KFB5_9BURK|nr:response regulator [Paraburkholderia unamae]PVX76947.1 winged helix family two component transcriptional regulator [Paraburkholderia unamae]